MPKCKNGNGYYTPGGHPSPKSRGFCARNERLGVRKKGGDGKLWVVAERSNGSRYWKKWCTSCKKGRKPRRKQSFKKRKARCSGARKAPCLKIDRCVWDKRCRPKASTKKKKKSTKRRKKKSTKRKKKSTKRRKKKSTKRRKKKSTKRKKKSTKRKKKSTKRRKKNSSKRKRKRSKRRKARPKPRPANPYRQPPQAPYRPPPPIEIVGG